MAKTIKHEQLSKFFAELFKKAGVRDEEAELVISGLVETSLRGVDSHGIRLVPHYLKCVLGNRVNKNANPQFTQTGASTGTYDADHMFGIVAGTRAMEKAIELAKESGVGAVAIKNSNHFSAAAIYGLMAGRKDMLGMVFSNTTSLVVPHGGKKPFLGTNPISFVVPCEGEEPFCLDMATSMVPRNKVNNYKEKGLKLEQGWAVDSEGQSTTDPALAANLMPLGGYKGYGLGLMVEIMSSVLTGMPIGPSQKDMYKCPYNERRFIGHFMVVMDISRFQDLEIFKKRMKDLMDTLRSQEPIKGYDKVRVAGDPEKEKLAETLKNGILVTDAELKNFREIAKQLGVDSGVLD